MVVYPPPESEEPGAQIDLIIDRADQCMNLCEIKYYHTEFKLEKAQGKKLLYQKEKFRELTKTRKTLFTTLIPTFGCQENAYLNHLALERKLFWSSCHVAASAMIFFYNQVLADREIRFKIPLRKTPRRLPVVLSLQAAKRLVNALQNEKHRVFLKTVYSAGLRLREATHLRVRDIDSARMTIRVESGKGLGGPGQRPLYGAFKKIVTGVAGVLPPLSSGGMAVFWPV